MLCRGLDAQRADQAHALAKCDRQRRIGRAAANQKHGRIVERIAYRQLCLRQIGVMLPPQHGGMQRAHPQRGVEPGDKTFRFAVGACKRNGIRRQAVGRIEDDQGRAGLERFDLRRKIVK